MSNEHPPVSPGAVDLDELDRLLATHRTSTDADAVTDAVVRLTRALPRILAEVRTLRARVESYAMDLAALDGTNAANEGALRIQLERLQEERSRAESAEARVRELEAWLVKLSESLGPRPFHLPDATLSEVVQWQVESTLRALKHETNEHDRHHKVEEQQAARITDLESQLAAAREEQTRLRGLFDTTRHLVLRSMGVEDMGHGWFWIESELAAAREEQGLEAKVREVLGERFDHLNASRCIVNGEPEWFTDTRNIWPRHSFVSAPTLPALLRAILEVEAKGAR